MKEKLCPLCRAFGGCQLESALDAAEALPLDTRLEALRVIVSPHSEFRTHCLNWPKESRKTRPSYLPPDYPFKDLEIV